MSANQVDVEPDEWRSKLSDSVTTIVAAYVSKNRVSRSDLPALIALVDQALTAAVTSRSQSASGIQKPTKSEIAKSIQRDSLISFLDGKPYKALRRHLRFNGHTPESYRALYGLPINYPMVAPSYSERRTEISRQISAMKRQ
jgi:predicted transcriptional regulator